MRIFTTLDCIKLTDFEKLLLVLIKGAIYDFDHSINGTKFYVDTDKVITVKPTDGSQGKLTTFKIENSAPGLFDEVKTIIKPFIGNFNVQGGFTDEKMTTTIILQRFEVVREHLTYYNFIGK